VLNVGSGIGRSVLDVVASVDTVLGLEGAEIQYRPGRAVDVPANILDVSLIGRELGWAARTDWLEGLRGTADWLRRIGLPAAPRGRETRL
jgi:UDP-glucose 4-epimerase